MLVFPPPNQWQHAEIQVMIIDSDQSGESKVESQKTEVRSQGTEDRRSKTGLLEASGKEKKKNLYFKSEVLYLCKKELNMNILARKMNFVQEFLRISDEDLVIKLENFLKSERKKRFEKDISPMTMDEFIEMIESSEDDAKNGRVTEARELLNRIEKWK